MPKPKAAKAKADHVEANEAREVLQLLDCNAAPPVETLQRLFRLDMAPCSAACGKSKGNPQNPCCFHGLLPAQDSFRKKGLWQKEPVLGQLGHDPADDKQQAPGAPAGLRNLGNTCYVNAAMQFLHSLPAFRNALYMLEPELAEQEIVRQLRDLFVEMHFGPKRYVDPEPFANSLLLDHGIQQDGQEFLKLLLSKLEVVFAASQQPEVATVIQGLFQGHLSHVTTCHTCNQPSEGSKREVEFYELSLQVQQMPSLHHSLVAALAPDELAGDNQYFCDFCAAKSDADRRMRLRSLPPYLCLALQRFTYDYETWEKKKVLHKLPIPLKLDVGQVLVDAGLPLPEAAPLGPDKQPVLPGSPNSLYELVAVLIHKGTSASHGHYVAHIKLHDTGTWWRFDDEEAVEMGQQPTSHPGDHGTTAAAATAAATSGGGGAAAAPDDDSKPVVGKKRGRGGSAGGGSFAKRGRGGSRGGGARAKRGGGKKVNRREPWEGDSDADAEAEAATAAAEADEEERALQQAMQLSLAEANGDMGYTDLQQAAAAAAAAAAADMASAQCGAGSRSRRAGEGHGAGSRDKARGRGAGRGRGRTAAVAEEPADTAAAAAGDGEPGPALPAALVEQILSANAYFLVYRQIPPDSSQPAAAPAAAADVEQTAADAQPSGELAASGADTSLPGLQAHCPPHETAGAGAVAAGNVAAEQQQQTQRVQLGAEAPAQPAQWLQAPVAVAEQQPVQQAQQVVQQPVTQQQQPSEQQLPLAAQQLQAQLRELPAAVQQQVARLHQAFQESCSRFEQKRQEALTGVAARQQEVRSIADLLPAADGDSGCFISLNWLEAWANSEGAPDPIDNSVLLCEHQKLNPLLPPATYKYISNTAWQQLTALHRGGPELRRGAVCITCLRRHLQGLVCSEDLVALREQLLAALDEDEANQEVLDAGGYYVSKTWVTGFRRRTIGSGVTGRLDAPTAGITCPHNSLAPERRLSSSKRFAVSAGTWSMLRRMWAQQVLADVQARRDKVVRAAAKRAAAGGVDAAAAVAAAAADKDDDCVILDSPKANKQQEQAAPAGDADDVCMVDADAEQQPDTTAVRATSPEAVEVAAEANAAAAAAPSWQPPFPLDGSVELSEGLLLQHLPEFGVANSYDCEVCAVTLQEAAAGHQEVKQQLEGQKQVLGKLLAGSVTEALETGTTYYLVPNAWLDTWRKHLQAALSKKLIIPAQLPPPPEPLPQAIRMMMCGCHTIQPLLAVPMPTIVNKRGRFSQADPQKDALRVVTAHEWQQLLLHHSGLHTGDDSDAAAAAAGGSRRQQELGAATAGSRSRRAAKKVEQGCASREEQRQVLVQTIASLADSDVGFRGIRAWLKVAPCEPKQQQQHQQQLLQQQQGQVEGQPEQEQHTQQDAAKQGLQLGSEVQQQQQQQQQAPDDQAGVQTLPQHNADLQQQQQQHVSLQGNGFPEHGSPGCVQQEPPVQEAQANGSSHSPVRGDLPIQRQPQEQQRQQPQEQLDVTGDCDGKEAVDLTELSPSAQQRRSKRHRQAAVVDLCHSPKRQAGGDADVVMVDSVDLADEPVAAAVAQANGDHAQEVLIEEVIARAGPTSHGQPAGVFEGQPQHLQQPGGTAERGTRLARQSARRAVGGRASTASALAAAAAAASSGATGGSDTDEAGVTGAPPVAMRGWLEAEPGPCEATLEAEAAARRAATLVYDAAELMVELVAEDELQAAFSAAGGGERRSRRARKNRQPIKASSTDTLAMLRLKVFEVLSVHPKNQRLYVRGRLLEGELDTLAKLEVFPDEEIRLVNANQVPDDDYASVFDGVAGKRKAHEVETGFKDTALHGSSMPAPTAAATPPQQDSGAADDAEAQPPQAR